MPKVHKVQVENLPPFLFTTEVNSKVCVDKEMLFKQKQSFTALLEQFTSQTETSSGKISCDEWLHLFLWPTEEGDNRLFNHRDPSAGDWASVSLPNIS